MVGSAMRERLKSAANAGLSGYDDILRWKSRRRPRLLVYTDSRGLNVASRLVRRHYNGSYVHRLQWRYSTDYVVSPHSHTTILDFLNYVANRKLDAYDAIIMHCGIVDFSPRPLSNVERVRAGKQGMPLFGELFAANAEYYANPWSVEYEGEPTINLYSLEYLRTTLLPSLQAIPNLIWISPNRFVAGWNGNYARGRPANIGSVVAEFEAAVKAGLPRVVDLWKWSDREVRTFTIDNIHFSRPGFKRLTALIEAELV